VNMRVNDVTFDAATDAIIEKVRKLLALAKNNSNEAEAESANNKARELLEAYNLDIAHVNRDTNGFTPRDKQKLRGGLYGWQRDLWFATAQLNFCKYWFYRGLGKGQSYEHELLGSKVNVLSTTLMANYLQDTVERLAREWMRDNRPGLSIFTKEAIAFREGITSRLVQRMWNIRYERQQADEARRKAEREAHAARGVFTENALTISDVVNTEEDLNNDHVMGWPMGTSAQNRRDREAAQAIAQAKADEELKRQNAWDEAHPEEAAARKAAEKAKYDEWMAKHYAKQKAKDQRPRKPTPEEERRAMSSFHKGYDAGGDISLDQQIDEDKRRLK
jgi:hypothetical protein